MSYLSEVIIGLRKCDYDRLLKEAKEKDIEANTQIHQYIQRGRENVPPAPLDGYVLLHWKNTKWYEDFDDVSFIEYFLDEICHYDFLRIGEGLDDIEERLYTGHQLFGVQRAIIYL